MQLKALAFLSLLAVVTGVAGPQHPEAAAGTIAAQRQIMQLERHWLAHELDPAVQSKLLAPGFVHVLPEGFINRQQQLQYLRAHPDTFRGTRRFERLRVRIYGDVALATGVVAATPAAGGPARRTMFTDVFAQINGAWLVVNSQENTASALVRRSRPSGRGGSALPGSAALAGALLSESEAHAAVF